MESSQAAQQLVLAAVAVRDPDAQVSPSLWARVEPLYQEIYDSLVDHPAADADLREGFGRAVAEPGHAELHRMLRDETDRLLRHDPQLRATSETRLVRIAEFGRSLPHRGEDYALLPPATTERAQIEALRALPPRSACPAERVEILVVLSFRVVPGEDHRLRNVLACLAALALQDLPATDVRIVAVEQDREPRLRELVAPFVDSYIFARNPGPYNYAWGRNVGVRMGGPAHAVCLLDVDIAVPTDFLSRCLHSLSGDVGGLLPYDKLLVLDAVSSSAAAASLVAGRDLPPPEAVRGTLLREVYGGAIVATSDVYSRIGGQDERYRGWGDEDNEFYFRLREVTEVRRNVAWAYHLNHPRPQMRKDGARINAAPMASRRELGGEFGLLDLYRDEP